MLTGPSRHIARRLLAPLLTLVLAFAAGPNALAATADDSVAAARSSLSTRAWQLASEGQLDHLWQQVKGLAEQATDDPDVASLREMVASYEEHERERRAQTRAAFERAVERLGEHIEGGDIRDALGEAVRARDLADDPRALLGRPEIAELVETAERRAREHARTAEWLRALSYYRALQILFEDQERYRDELRGVARHVALLRLYAPEELYALYVREAEERGEEKPEPWMTEEDHWRTQLEGIVPDMVTEGLRRGATQYVEGTSFEQMLLGGIEALTLLLDTRGLEKTFPALADPDKAGPFAEHLDSVRRGLENRDTPMDYADASRTVDQLLARNTRTLDLPQPVIVRELGEGAMAKLDDFSSVIWPHQKARFERTTTGQFFGVGVQITLIDRELTVVTPLEDTPARRAGIRSGDRIVTINGRSTMGIDLEQAVEKITGPEGTEVTLGIQSSGEEQVRQVTLERSPIRVVSVKGWEHRAGGGWDFHIDPEMKIGYVRMTTFGPNTADELDDAVAQMRDGRGLEGLILDLRSNPGGRLDAAVHVANRFLSSGEIVSTSQETFLGRTWRAEADASHTYDPFPLVVLIDKSSASASEIIAGALQDHGRALIVGERTFGKGSVQNLFPIGREAAYLKLTTQYYELPTGRIIHRRPGAEDWGVNPDVPVRITDRQAADAAQARTYLDILREDGEAVDPDSVINRRSRDGEEQELPPITSPQDILTYGIDPQLETALLLIKTRLLGEL